MGKMKIFMIYYLTNGAWDISYSTLEDYKKALIEELVEITNAEFEDITNDGNTFYDLHSYDAIKRMGWTSTDMFGYAVIVIEKDNLCEIFNWANENSIIIAIQECLDVE